MKSGVSNLVGHQFQPGQGGRKLGAVGKKTRALDEVNDILANREERLQGLRERFDQAIADDTVPPRKLHALERAITGMEDRRLKTIADQNLKRSIDKLRKSGLDAESVRAWFLSAVQDCAGASSLPSVQTLVLKWLAFENQPLLDQKSISKLLRAFFQAAQDAGTDTEKLSDCLNSRLAAAGLDIAIDSSNKFVAQDSRILDSYDHAGGDKLRPEFNILSAQSAQNTARGTPQGAGH